MRKIYLLTFIFYFILLGARAFSIGEFILPGVESADSVRRPQQRPATKITDTRANKPARDIGVKITPFKPMPVKAVAGASAATASAASPAQKGAAADFKVLSNVRVYPNPTDDQITLSYSLSKESNVTIKIMDVLGNELATLLSQRIPAGEQNHSYSIGSRLNSGYYFIRLIAGSETVVKRISLL